MSNTLCRDPVCSCPIKDYRGLRLHANELWLHFLKKNERRRCKYRRRRRPSVVNGSLDLAARATVLQAFLFNYATIDAAKKFALQRQMNRA
jgi:hypothetical protein